MKLIKADQTAKRRRINLTFLDSVISHCLMRVIDSRIDSSLACVDHSLQFHTFRLYWELEKMLSKRRIIVYLYNGKVKVIMQAFAQRKKIQQPGHLNFIEYPDQIAQQHTTFIYSAICFSSRMTYHSMTVKYLKIGTSTVITVTVLRI